MKTKNIVKIVILSVVLVLFLVTLFFSNQLENLLLLKPNLQKVYNNSLSVHFVDVGQGDAILVRFPNNKTMLIDSGSENHKNNLLNYINNVFFNNAKNKTFDYVMLTHPDADHMGNMLTIFNSYKVNNFLRPNIYAEGIEKYDGFNASSGEENYVRLVAKAYALNINMKFATPDFSDENLNEYMRILTPIRNNYSDENSFSPIISLTHNGVKFLLTGDATKQNELELINNYSEEIYNCDVLKLGHHGSSTSTGEQFLNETSPSAVVISYGKDNSYLHPSEETINKIVNYAETNNLKYNNLVYETAKQGNIIFSVKNNAYDVTTINNVNNYVFVNYWVVVVIVIALLIVFVILPYLIKFLFSKKSNNVLKP